MKKEIGFNPLSSIRQVFFFFFGNLGGEPQELSNLFRPSGHMLRRILKVKIIKRNEFRVLISPLRKR